MILDAGAILQKLRRYRLQTQNKLRTEIDAIEHAVRLGIAVRMP